MVAFLRHLVARMRPWRAWLSAGARTRFTELIAESEAQHGAEILFVIERALPTRYLFVPDGDRKRAKDLFETRGVIKTRERTGVLLYFVLADGALEVVADEGVISKLSQGWIDRWCSTLCEQLRIGVTPVSAISEGMLYLTEELARQIPRRDDDSNELPNEVQ